MLTSTALLYVAGAIQLVIAAENLVLPRMLHYREGLASAPPLIRQVFFSHAGYVVGIVVLFGVICFAFPAELAGASPLGRFLAGAMAFFWGLRIPLQLFYFDPAVRKANRLGDVVAILAALYLTVVMASAGLGVIR